MTRVLLHNSDTDALADIIVTRFPDVDIATCNTYADLAQHLAAFRPDAVYSVRFDGTPGFPRDALFGTHAPHWIANGGAGTDHFGTWDTDKITVTNAAGVAADMMAEYVMGGFLHFTLDVPGLLADASNGIWNAKRTVVPLKGKTLLIVGLGHTGRAIAQKAKAFGMHIIGTRARPQPMEHVDDVLRADQLTAALARADFVAVATPLTAQTRNLIGADQFSAMKPGVILADVSRGGVVDQRALLDALCSGHVAGAALDVFETEPLSKDSPFWTQETVLISPHCSSVYDGWDLASFDLFLDNLARFQTGQPLLNVVDPTRGY